MKATWVFLRCFECQVQMKGQSKMQVSFLKSKRKHVSIGRSLNRGRTGEVLYFDCKVTDSISKDVFISKLGKRNLKKITVYWVYVSTGHSQNGTRWQMCWRSQSGFKNNTDEGTDNSENLGMMLHWEWPAKTLEEKVEKLSVKMGWHLLWINYKVLQFSWNTQTL